MVQLKLHIVSPRRKNVNRRNRPFPSVSRRRHCASVSHDDERKSREATARRSQKYCAPTYRDASSVGFYHAQIYRARRFLPETARICDAYRETETLKISDVGTNDGARCGLPKIELRHRNTRETATGSPSGALSPGCRTPFASEK